MNIQVAFNKTKVGNCFLLKYKLTNTSAVYKFVYPSYLDTKYI